MRRVGSLLLAVAVVAGLVLADRLGLFGTKAASDWDQYERKLFAVTHVVDGDTFDVACPDGPRPCTRIRLWGVDTPETVNEDTPVQHFGPEASARTHSLLAGQTVTLHLLPETTRDKYDRLLAYVVLPDGRQLNRLLVEEGCAYADPRYRHPQRAEFERLQRRARRAGRGLWANATAADLPYYYRGQFNLPEESK